MLLKFNILLVLILCVFHVYAQKVDSDATVKSMKLEITNFFIKHKLLKREEVNGSLNYVFATEIKEQKVLGYNVNGIYRIGIYQSHSGQHILIKENLVFKTFDVDEIGTVLREVIEYSKRNNLTEGTMLIYLKAIIEMYESNNKNG